MQYILLQQSQQLFNSKTVTFLQLFKIFRESYLIKFPGIVHCSLPLSYTFIFCDSIIGSYVNT